MGHQKAQKSQKILRTQFCLCVLVALAPLSVVGQVATPSPTTQTSKIGKITGKVVNEKGQPLPNATVVVRAFGAMTANQSTTTDNSGKFEVSGLDRVNYQVYAWIRAYAPLPRDPAETQSNIYRVGDSVTLVMSKGGVITGTVTTQTGEPLVGVQVRARMIRDGDRLPWPYGQMPQERMTDDRGVYRIYGLAAGTYVVSAGGGSSNPMDPFGADVPTYAPGSTRDTAAEITVRAGEETNNVDIRYRGESGHIVSGTVRGLEAGQSTGTIRGLETGQSPIVAIDLTSVSDNEWGSMKSVHSSDGRSFAFHGVDDGDYYVTARSLLSSQEWAFSTLKQVTVRGEDVTGIDLVAQPPGSVTGRVVLEDSNAAECADKERPVFAETQVSAWHRENDAAKNLPQFIWSLGAPANPDAQGNVTLRNLAPGEYRFVAQFSGKYWYLQSINLTSPKTQANKPVDAMRAWTRIKSGDRLSGLTVTLAQGAASLRGQIAIAEGETLPEKLIAYLVPAEREKADDVLRYFAVRVTPDGKIAFNNLAPGRYWILAQPAVDDAQSPLTKLRLPDGTETRSTLRRAAEASKSEIEFKPCQQVADFRLKL